MRISDITTYLEGLAPLSSQESYDNSGLIIGDPNVEVEAALVCLDCIEEIVEEAIALGCNLIIAHHPIIFKGLKKINGANYIERTIIKAIKHDIAIYAIHTNFDHFRYGVNFEIGERLGLTDLRILSPKESELTKLICYVPEENCEEVSQALFGAGAGGIGNYSDCSFKTEGVGTYRPLVGAEPFEGKVGELSTVQEIKLEVLVSNHLLTEAIDALKNAHPYEEVAYELVSLRNSNQYEGAGMIGELKNAIEENKFLSLIKSTFNCGVIRHTETRGKGIKKVAFCGGSGSFLLNNAKRSGADIFITGDFKYHEFFDAENDIIIADIGHFESEQFTSNKLARILTKKFPNFAVHLTKVNTNPINYF